MTEDLFATMSQTMVHNGAAPYPLGTVVVIGLCVFIQLWVFLFNPPLNQFTLSALLVVYSHQYWRIVTSAYFHGGLMHILFNMTSVASLGGSLERCMGSIFFVYTVLWQTILCGTFNVAASWFLSMVVFDDLSYLKQQSVGFSGVIFALAVVDIHRSDLPTRSLFGFFEVPAKLYPWALLVALQILIPNVSFLGHLSGILMGTLQAYGGLNFLFPSYDFIRRLETSLPCPAAIERAICGSHRFVPARDDAWTPRQNLTDLYHDAAALTLRFVAWGSGLLRQAATSTSFRSSSPYDNLPWGGGGTSSSSSSSSFVL